MKFSVLFLALFHSVMLATQEVPVEYNIYSATLCSGDKLYFGDKAVKFKEVISDSRCPSDVTCIWAGEVKVLVEFFENGEFKGEKIITNPNISVAAFFDGDPINLKNFKVTPYPKTSNKIAPEEYMINLSISEKVKAD